MNLKDIKEILSTKNLDARVIPFVELFVLGKSKVDNLDDKEVSSLIDKLCINIKNTEFIEGEKIIAAYTRGANILSINKNYLTEERVSEAVVPIFMKMEQSLHTEDENEYARHSLDLAEAYKIARQLQIPTSSRLQNLGSFAELLIDNTKQYLNKDHIKEIEYLEGLARNFERTLNEMIITGQDDRDAFLEGYRALNIVRYQEKDEGKRDKLYSREEALKLIKVLDSIGIKKAIVEMLASRKDRTYEEYIRPDIMRQGELQEEEISSYSIPSIDADDKVKGQLGRIGSIKPEDISVSFIEDRIEELLKRKGDKWNSGMGRLLIPFFIRSAVIFGWNKDELVTRINELDSSIKTIEYVDSGLKEEVLGTAGKEDIRIRRNMYGYTMDNYHVPLSTLYHEAGHAIDSNTREGIVSKTNEGYSFDKFYEWRNTIFEYLVSRTSGSFYRDEYGFIVEPHSGYIETLNVGSMLSAALGISELEFAKLKDKGNDSIGKFLMKVTGMPEEEVIPQSFKMGERNTSLMERLCINFDLAYPMPFDFKARLENQERINDMYEACLQIMRRRMETDLIQGDGDDNEYLVRQAYFLRKINENYKVATKDLGTRMKKMALTHRIDFASDRISQIALYDIGKEYIDMVDFGFDNARDIAPYRLKDLSPKKQSIFDKLKLAFVPTVSKGNKETTKDRDEDKDNIK